ncbi:MAG: glycosyltransferase family 39 protein [Caldilineaceae bacterium]
MNEERSPAAASIERRFAMANQFAEKLAMRAVRSGFALGIFGLLTALFYAPILLGLRTFPDGDFTHHFLPFSLFQRQEFLAGWLPVWNPYTYGGHPFLADVQAAVFYPLNNLLLLLTLPFGGVGARLYFLQMEAVVHVALGGFFTYLLVRHLTGNATAALFSGVIFAFSGYLTGYPPLQLAILRTAIWLPLLLLLALIAVQSQDWRWWIGLGVGLAIALLAGHPQTFLHIGYALAAWLVFLWLGAAPGDGRGASRDTRPTIYVIGGAALALAVMVGLSAAQLLPSLEFSRLSVRADVSYDFVSGGLPLRDTWQLLLPGLFTQFSPLYVGVIGLGLAVCALGVTRNAATDDGPRAWPTQRGIVLFCALLGLVALLLSYGGNGFLYPIFYKIAPGWNYFRGQERAAYLVTLALSVLSGMGVAALNDMPLARRRLLGLAFCVIAIATVYGVGLLYQLNGATAISEWRYLAMASGTLLLVSLFGLLMWLPGWGSGRSVGLLTLALINLFWANMGTNISDFGPARKTILAPEMEALGAAVAAQEDETGLPGRVYNEFRLYEDYGMRQQIEDVWGSSPLRLARYAALFDDFPLDRMWRLLGVQYVVSWRRELFGPSELLGEFPQSQDTTFIHRLPPDNPRAWVAPQVQYAGDEEALRLLADHTFDLNRIALLPIEMAPAVQVAPTRGESNGKDIVSIERPAPAQFHITVASEHGGLLVISENWLPGWRISDKSCTINGTFCKVQDVFTLPAPDPASPLRVNLTQIGIPIQPGETRFTLTYQPNSINYGVGISGGVLLVLVLFVFRQLHTFYYRRRNMH